MAQQGKIKSVETNIKAGYQAHGKPLYVHSVTLEDGVTYEYHSQSTPNPKKVGDVVWYTVGADTKGNKKIKFEKAPEGAPSYAPSFDPSRSAPSPNPKVTAGVDDRFVWLSVFSSLATFKAGDPTVDIAKLIEGTNHVVKQVRGE